MQLSPMYTTGCFIHCPDLHGLLNPAVHMVITEFKLSFMCFMFGVTSLLYKQIAFIIWVINCEIPKETTNKNIYCIY